MLPATSTQDVDLPGPEPMDLQPELLREVMPNELPAASTQDDDLPGAELMDLPPELLREVMPKEYDLGVAATCSLLRDMLRERIRHHHIQCAADGIRLGDRLAFAQLLPRLTSLRIEAMPGACDSLEPLASLTGLTRLDITSTREEEVCR